MPFPDKLPFSFVLSCAAGMLLMAAVLVLPACLQGFGVQRGTGPDGRPTVELCAELARAQPSASAPSVAVALPTVAPSSSAAPEGVLRHAQ